MKKTIHPVLILKYLLTLLIGALIITASLHAEPANTPFGSDNLPHFPDHQLRYLDIFDNRFPDNAIDATPESVAPEIQYG